MKLSRVTALIIILITSAVMSPGLPAMGAKDDSDAYKSELKQVFTELIEEIYTGRTDAASAKNRLSGLRNKYGIAYTDEAGILDSIIDRVKEGSLTRSEAELYFELLSSGKLADYRKEDSRRQSALNNDRTAGRDGTGNSHEAGSASAGSDEQPPAAQKPPSTQPAPASQPTPSQQPVQGQQPSGGGGNPRG